MKRIIVTMLAAAVCLSGFAQGQFVKKEFEAKDGTVLLYNQLDPVGLKAGTKCPVVLFLHGAGERGNDNEKQLVHGSGMFLNPVNQEKYPCYALFPQCPEGRSWAYDKNPKWSTSPWDLPADFPQSQYVTVLFELLQQFLAQYPQANPDKVYVMGLSMGGIGTYEMCIRHPEMFAAAVPICGCVNPSRLAKAKSVKFSIYHGDSDNVVPTTGSREAYKALKAAGCKVRYKEFVGCEHGSWNPAFNEPDFFSWLFKQHR